MTAHEHAQTMRGLAIAYAKEMAAAIDEHMTRKPKRGTVEVSFTHTTPEQRDELRAAGLEVREMRKK